MLPKSNVPQETVETWMKITLTAVLLGRVEWAKWDLMWQNGSFNFLPTNLRKHVIGCELVEFSMNFKE